MDIQAIIKRFYALLPTAQDWIDRTLAEYGEKAIPVRDCPFTRLRTVFPQSLLSEARAVVVTGQVPFPPFSRMGVPELALMEDLDAAGITYKNTFFVQNGHLTESLCFHELIHVIQWQRLGVERFLFAYLIGLLQFGYRRSPLERMAYTLQTEFDQNAMSGDLVETIKRQTDTVWEEAGKFLALLG